MPARRSRKRAHQSAIQRLRARMPTSRCSVLVRLRRTREQYEARKERRHRVREHDFTDDPVLLELTVAQLVVPVARAPVASENVNAVLCTADDANVARYSSRLRHRTAASRTLTIETTSATNQDAASVHEPIAAPSAVPIAMIPAVATSRTKTDSKPVRRGRGDRKPSVPVRASVGSSRRRHTHGESEAHSPSLLP